MILRYKGKTKDVYEDQGQTLLVFKDTMTGRDGVFDPGENQVGLTVEGSGKKALCMSTIFFEKLQEAGIATHFLSSDVDQKTMNVRPVTIYGKGLEFICRFRAIGSFYKRYESYLEWGQPLEGYVECTLKDDERFDPLVTSDGVEALGLMRKEEFEQLSQQTQTIARLIQSILSSYDLSLYDIKFEFGRDIESKELLLIDEISAGNMRVYKDGRMIDPMELYERLLPTQK